MLEKVEITKEYFEDWMNNPVTKEVLNIIKTIKENVLYSLTYNSIKESPEIFNLQGRLQLVSSILDISFEDVKDMEERH
jgi:hypothetical protein